jgi:mannose-6-phosphate isomerase-like protein (cupin superfamily)
MEAYFVDRAQGEVARLGAISMRLLAPRSETDGSFAVAEFRGAEGPWTIPHVHERLEESFYILDGSFTFACGDRAVEAEQGAFLVVPRGTPHVLSAGPEGGALLVLWTPGGLEEMFLELGRLPADSITDPAVRAEIARRHDSVPV